MERMMDDMTMNDGEKEKHPDVNEEDNVDEEIEKLWQN